SPASTPRSLTRGCRRRGPCAEVGRAGLPFEILVEWIDRPRDVLEWQSVEIQVGAARAQRQDLARRDIRKLRKEIAQLDHDQAVFERIDAGPLEVAPQVER